MNTSMSNESILQLFKLLGNIQNRLKVVHITGTNGKGSTLNHISRFLKNCGTFTSPYLLSPLDSIRVDNIPISLNEFTMIQTRLLNLCFTNSIHLSKFELLVATAVNYFVDWNCDICVIEVGVGGLRDATNVFNTPLICVFTKISLDHQEILGDTLELIAIEKSGIIKQGCQVISCFQDSKVLGVLKEECMKLNCALIVDNEQEGRNENRCLAERVLIPLCEMKIRIQPVEKDYIWPARLHRMQVTCLGNVLVDGAHNQDGLEYLGNYIANTNFNDIDFMIGVSEGRNPKLVYEMVKKTGLLKNVSRISLFNFENVPDMEWIKCTEIKVLLDQFQDFEGVKSYLHVSDFFLENEVERKDIEYVEGLYKCDKSRLTVVCGSLYFCSSFLRFIDYKIG